MKFILVALCSLLVSTASAAEKIPPLYIEPFLGYGLGNYKYGDVGSDSSGAFYGIRVGSKFHGLAFGMEGTGADTSVKFKNKTEPASIGESAGFLSYQFGMGLRLYAALALDSAIEFRERKTGGGRWVGGGFKFGIGYRIFKYLVFNLEYWSKNYSKYDGVDLGEGDTKPSTTYYLATLNIPIVVGDDKSGKK